jgi:glycyl-tRNA synthetase
MNDVLSFQEAVQRLHAYWASQGCLIWQPANTEVGAGTMNQATFLRVLGPEPWRVAYIEPSVRPDDSRYGDNPNRVQMHTQYQLILKPDPGNPQELYLKSLEAIGIDTGKHDIRFVEDNWESPALGAWGLGWEVWLDGLEISQYTYFQQCGGFVLNPVSVEITYGLDRILMTRQRVRHFKELLYAPGLTYGELLGQNEYEMSVYNLDAADVPRLGQLFELCVAEAQMLVTKGLPLPAHSYVLKASHVFNLLDSRGTVGVTERARFFARMRDLARQVAGLWLKKREELGFPLGQVAAGTPAEIPPPPIAQDRPETFLLEIGSEELPPGDVTAALDQMRRLVPGLFRELRLTHGAVEIEATPRRLMVLVRDVAARQADEEFVARGPRSNVAFDSAGQPTKAGAGFARGQKVAVEALQRQVIDGQEYVVVPVRRAGLPAGAVLREAMPKLLARIAFPHSMRWNPSNVAYSRPLRWFVALLGNQVVPFTYAGISSGRESRAFRNSPSPTFVVATAEEYPQRLRDHELVVSAGERREMITRRIASLAAEAGGVVPTAMLGDLLDEVTNLVEAPTPILGRFETSHLELPGDVLTTVMRHHQRYFPVEDRAGRLLPLFIGVANGKVDEAVVRAGYEDVIRARFADAAFFWTKDCARRLEDFRPDLDGLSFHEKLGSMRLKNDRIEKLVPAFAGWLGLSEAELRVLTRAAHLAKADLVTQMVIEFTSLAGLMGREYALRSGESPEVAQAIFELVLPRFSGDMLPASRAGMVLGLADRLDSLVGLFSVGLMPRGSADPFALRRAAQGVVQILLDRNIDLDLRAAIHAVAEIAPLPVSPECELQLLQFIQRRLDQLLLERGERLDLVQAALSARGHRPAFALATLREAAGLVDSERFARVLTAYSRPARLVRDQPPGQVAVSPAVFQAPEEQELWAACQTAAAALNPSSSLGEFLEAFERVVTPINRFFEKVFVMVDDRAVRHNRLALLQALASLAEGIFDLTKVEGF